jgi:HEAT repeat protein
LQSNKVEVRTFAASRLGRLGAEAKAAVPVLAAALRDREAGVREQAALALGKIGHAAWTAAPGLGQALKDRDAGVRRQAARSLGELGPDAHAAVAPLLGALGEHDLHAEAFQALVKMGKPAVPDLVEALQDRSHYQLRLSAIAILGRLGPDAAAAVAPLSDLAEKEQYKSLRQAAQDALQKIQRRDG